MTREDFLKFLWKCGFRSNIEHRNDLFLAFTYSDPLNYRKAEKALRNLGDGNHLRDFNVLSLEGCGFFVIVRNGNDGVQRKIKGEIGSPLLSINGAELYFCANPIAVGNLQLNPETREAKWKDRTRILPDLRFQLLSFLAQQAINGARNTDNYILTNVLGETGSDESDMEKLRRTVFNTNELFRDRSQASSEPLIVSTYGGYGLSIIGRGGPITIGDLRIDPEDCKVYSNNLGYSLPPKQFAVVWYLASRTASGQVNGVPRDEILSACWETCDRVPQVFNVTMRYINEKAANALGVDEPLIERVPGSNQNYRLVSKSTLRM